MLSCTASTLWISGEYVPPNELNEHEMQCFDICVRGSWWYTWEEAKQDILDYYGPPKP